MKDESSESGLQRAAESDTRKFNSRYSYGIIGPTYDLDEPLYTLRFDPETSQLLINKMVIKTFQYGEDNERVFIGLFDKLAEANRYKTKFDHDFVTEIEILVKANQAQAIVNNIKIPLSLRKAIFRTSKSGSMLHVQTVVTKARAVKYGISNKEISAFAKQLHEKDPKLIRSNIR